MNLRPSEACHTAILARAEELDRKRDAKQIAFPRQRLRPYLALAACFALVIGVLGSVLPSRLSPDYGISTSNSRAITSVACPIETVSADYLPAASVALVQVEPMPRTTTTVASDSCIALQIDWDGTAIVTTDDGHLLLPDEASSEEVDRYVDAGSSFAFAKEQSFYWDLPIDSTDGEDVTWELQVRGSENILTLQIDYDADTGSLTARTENAPIS